MSNLYIDITQLIHWPGKLTGIPRVMNELAIRYAKSNHQVRFITWDNDLGRYYEVDIEASLRDRSRKVHHRIPSGLSGSQMSSFESSLKSANEAYVIPSLHRLKNRRVRGSHRAIMTINSYHQRHSTVTFESGDTLFVMWGEWANKTYIETLERVHASGIKLIQIVYDILPLVTPQYSGHSTKSMQTYYSRIIPISDLVLAISSHSKKDLLKWLTDCNLKAPRVEVFRLGDDFQIPASLRPKKGRFASSGLKAEEFILCVGTIEARKNHTLLYYTYKLAAQRGINLPSLVIVGRRGWLADDLYELITKDPQISQKFVLEQDLSDENLAWLYKNCLFSIYPSFYEGWGLPIAESIAYGKPCVCSNTSSMQEIAGNLIDYFSPNSSDECLMAIQKLMIPSELKKAKRKINKYKPVSWDKTFTQVDEYVKDLYAKTN